MYRRSQRRSISERLHGRRALAALAFAGGALFVASWLGAPPFTPAASADTSETCIPVGDELGPFLRSLEEVAATRSDAALAALALLADRDLAARRGCEDRDRRSAAAAVLAKLASTGPAAERRAAVRRLRDAAAAETDPSLRAQMIRDLDRHAAGADRSDLPTIARLREEILPTSPPYDAIFGPEAEATAPGSDDPLRVAVRIHSAKEVLRQGGYFRLFRSLGATVVRPNAGEARFEYTVVPDDPTGRLKPVVYEIRLTDDWQDDYDNLDVFGEMGRKTPQIEMYDFHAQYGGAFDRSFEIATANRDARKLYLLNSCKSKVFGRQAKALYPATHFVLTRDGEYMVDTAPMLARTLQALAERQTYAQLRRSLAREELTNYQFPDDRAQLLYADADDDGVPDGRDDRLDCGRIEPPSRNTLRPEAPSQPPETLGGGRVLDAVLVANGLLGYHPTFGSRWEDRFVSGGFGPADPDGPIVTVSKIPGGRGRPTHVVTVNGAYSHLSKLALSAALCRELTLFAVTGGGRRKATLDDRILAYEVGVDLLSAWGDDGPLYQEYQARFGFDRPLPWSVATRAIDHHDGATDETVAKIRRYLERNNG